MSNTTRNLFWYHIWYHIWCRIWHHTSESMISRLYDIIAQWYHSQYLWYPYWYHVWYHIWYHGPASMISRLYAIIALWYQSIYQKIHVQYQRNQVWCHTWWQGDHTHRQKRAAQSSVEVALCRFKRRMFKIGCGDLAPSSTRRGSSSSSNAFAC